jgi:peptidoglycan/LPS O-acetylase OafA/YrhL
MPQTTKARFNFPDSLRGMAALWVMGQHLWVDRHTESLFQVLPGPVNRLFFQFGYLGVPIFFALSGFFMAHSLRKTVVTPRSLYQLFLRRFLRLSPAYYVSIGLALLFAAISTQLNGTALQLPSWGDLIKHFTYSQGLLPAQTVISGVYWTLCIEFQFYIAFCLLLGLSQWITRRSGWEQARTSIFGLAAILAALWPAHVLSENFPIPGLFLNTWHSCLLGIFAYWSWHKICNAWLFYGYVGILVGVTIASRSLFTGTAVLTAVSLYVAGTQNQMSHWLNHSWLQFAGLVSYTLYLTHEPLLKLLFPLGHRWLGFSVGADLACIAISFGLCLGLAKFLHWAVEIPSLQWSAKSA